MGIMEKNMETTIMSYAGLEYGVYGDLIIAPIFYLLKGDYKR